MGTMSLAGLGGLAAATASAEAAGAAPRSGARRPGPAGARGVTRALARYVVAARYADIPARGAKGSAAHAAQLDGLRRRRLAPRDARRRDWRAGAVLRARRRPPMLGRRERMDVLHAALMNGISSHVFDFDDTHLKTVIHPAGPGRLGAARAVGAPADVRAPTSSTRWSSASKWNAASATRSIPPTTTAAGTSPARPACSARRRRAARLLGLTEQQMVWALGPRGDPAGRPARDVRIDDQELPSRARGAERPDRGAAGLAQLHQHRGRASRARAAGPTCSAPRATTAQITGNLGESYEIALNTYKPFACGIVIHPDDRRLHPAAQPAQAAGRRHRAHRPAACIRWCWS